MRIKRKPKESYYPKKDPPPKKKKKKTHTHTHTPQSLRHNNKRTNEKDEKEVSS